MGGHQRTVPLAPSLETEDETIEKIWLASKRSGMVPKAAENKKTVRWQHSVGEMNGESKKILMVEDNEVNGKTALKLLSIAGYDADLAEDGSVALKIQQSPKKI